MTFPVPLQQSLSKLSRVIDSLIPRHCLFCLEQTSGNNDLCPHCRTHIQHNKLACQRCALPLSTSDSSICGNCLSHQYYYNQVYSPFIYTDAIRYLIRQLKYHNKIHYAQTLARLFIQSSTQFQDFQLPEVLIPMPMHTQRLQQRGYNQALELARFFAAHFQLQLDYKSLLRTRPTLLQAGLNAKERQKNVKNAFNINKHAHISRLSGIQHIALIDDVMTTGSTLNEAAKILRQSGIKRVDAWIIARA